MTAPGGQGGEGDRTHDRGLAWPTIATVDLMLKQLQRDRQTVYWGEPPHSEWLSGAESWLLSLRDWLESNPVGVVAYDNCPPAASHTCDECKRVVPRCPLCGDAIGSTMRPCAVHNPICASRRPTPPEVDPS